jgi:hypothetical protein
MKVRTLTKATFLGPAIMTGMQGAPERPTSYLERPK